MIHESAGNLSGQDELCGGKSLRRSICDVSAVVNHVTVMGQWSWETIVGGRKEGRNGNVGIDFPCCARKNMVKRLKPTNFFSRNLQNIQALH